MSDSAKCGLSAMQDPKRTEEQARLDRLIGKLEKATGPDQGLDAEIALAVGWAVRDRTLRGIVRHPVCLPLGGRWQSIPRFTDSLDAALSLVPAERRIDLVQSFDGTWWDCTVYRLGEEGIPAGETTHGVPTPAIALTIAALKARRA